MLTMEKMHLLLTRADGSSESPSAHGPALAAAALQDLAEAGVVRLEESRDPAQARVIVVAGGTAGHPVLDALLPAVDKAANTPLHKLVAAGTPKARKAVEAHLTEQGLLRREKSLLSTTHLPASTTARHEIRERLAAVLTGGAEATEADELLLAALGELNLAPTLLAGAGREQGRRELVRGIAAKTQSNPYAVALGASVRSLSGALSAAALPSAEDAAREEHERAAEAEVPEHRASTQDPHGSSPRTA
ncbi:GPP34 family phosphoprotein [uncultured Micrococcus sp.]|nr:GPP34 family phosphoprotein [uncultured Micrococcus sp.]